MPDATLYGILRAYSRRALSLGAETWPSTPHQLMELLPVSSLAAEEAVLLSSRPAASTDAASLGLHLAGERPPLVGCSGRLCCELVEGGSECWSEAMCCCCSSSFPSIFSRRWLMARSSLVCSRSTWLGL